MTGSCEVYRIHAWLANAKSCSNENIMCSPKVNQVCAYKYLGKQLQFGMMQEETISVAIGVNVEILCNSGEWEVMHLKVCTN